MNPEIEVFEDRTGLSSDEEADPQDMGDMGEFKVKWDKNLAAIHKI